MQGKLVVIKPDQTRTEVELTAAPKLPQLKEAMEGGLLEVVPYFRTFEGQSCVAFVDDEGKLKRLVPNLEATEIWHKQFPAAIGKDFLVGPLVVVVGDKALLRAL